MADAIEYETSKMGGLLFDVSLIYLSVNGSRKWRMKTPKLHQKTNNEGGRVMRAENKNKNIA